MDSDSTREELQPNRRDFGAALARSIIAAVPVVGPLLSEVVSSVIPRQRVDRIVNVLSRLEDRLTEMERSALTEDLLEDPEKVDLLEEGFTQATRAVSEERRERIAALLHSTLTEQDLSHIESTKLWKLLESVNDVELLILQSKEISGMPEESSFWEKHEDAVLGPAAHMGSTPEELARASIYEGYRRHLVELGLLVPNFKKRRSGEYPEFDDKTGMLKASGYNTTPLGRLLLKKVGMLTRH